MLLEAHSTVTLHRQRDVGSLLPATWVAANVSVFWKSTQEPWQALAGNAFQQNEDCRSVARANSKAAFKCQRCVLQIHLVCALETKSCPLVLLLAKGTQSPPAMGFPVTPTYSDWHQPWNLMLIPTQNVAISLIYLSHSIIHHVKF